MRIPVLILAVSLMALSQAKAGELHLCTASNPCGPASSTSSSGPHLCTPSDPCGPASSSPMQATAQDFAGTWQVHVNDGSVFPMTLVAFGKKIGGSYDPTNRVGTIIDGKIKDNTLKFKWITTGSIKAAGEGKFHMDDFNDLSGTWSMGFFTGTWMAMRQ